MDFKQEAIEINDELLIALKSQLILVKLVKDLATPKTYKLAGPDIENQIKDVENQIKRVTARKQILQEEA